VAVAADSGGAKLQSGGCSYLLVYSREDRGHEPSILGEFVMFVRCSTAPRREVTRGIERDLCRPVTKSSALIRLIPCIGVLLSFLGAAPSELWGQVLTQPANSVRSVNARPNLASGISKASAGDTVASAASPPSKPQTESSIEGAQDSEVFGEEYCPEEDDAWGGEEGDSEEVVGQSESAEGEPITRAPAPLVVLAGNGSSLRLTSGDARAAWTPVEYQKLLMQCELPDGLEATAYEFFVDGHRFSGVRDEAFESLDCPPLGRHLIQARYLHPELGWSRISAPVRFEVLAPRKPVIIAASDAREVAGPLISGGKVAITSGQVMLRLAVLSQATRIHAYLDGQYIGAFNVRDPQDCVVKFPIDGYATAGDHVITLRQAPAADACDLASAYSAPLRIHYFKQSAGVMRKTRELPQAASGAQTATTGEAHGNPTLATRREYPRRSSRIDGKSFVQIAGNAILASPPTDSQARHASTSRSITDPTMNVFAISTQPAEKTAADSNTPLPASPSATPNETKCPKPNQESLSAQHGQQQVGNQGSVHTFAAVARFPLRDYSLRGDVIERDGLMIYEGMTLAINPDGRYEVRFRTTTPPLPATLRLQFALKLNDREWHTLTLPPVKVLCEDERTHASRNLGSLRRTSNESGVDTTLDSDTQVFRLEGDFPVLNAQRATGWVGEVRRDGSVRFGYDPAKAAIQYVQ
jgi:hypothetical protein